MDEVLAVYGEVVEDAWKGLQESDPTLPASMGDTMRAMITPEMVTKAMSDDVSPLVSFACSTLQPHATYETLLPNALGGEPIPAHGDDILRPLLSRSLPEGSPELEAALDAMSLTVETRLDVVLDAATGWATSFRNERVTKVAMNDGSMPNGRTDSVVCTRIDQSG